MYMDIFKSFELFINILNICCVAITKYFLSFLFFFFHISREFTWNVINRLHINTYLCIYAKFKCAKIYRNAENDMQKALKYKYVLRMHVFEEGKSLFKLQVFSFFTFIKIWSCINIRSLMNNFIIHPWITLFHNLKCDQICLLTCIRNVYFKNIENVFISYVWKNVLEHKWFIIIK